jgi:signal transduction histidine kinase
MRAWATSIGAKTLSIFLVLVIVLTGLSMYSIDRGRDNITEAVGGDSVHYSSFVSSTIDRAIYLKYHELYQWSVRNIVQSLLIESNAEFSAMVDLEEHLSTVDAEWLSTPLDESTPFMDEMMEEDVSIRLREELVEHYLEEHGVEIYSRVAIANEFGAVVRMSSRTLGYSYANSPWWPELVEAADYFGRIEADPVTNVPGMYVFVRVDDPDGNFIGVMMAFINIVGVIDESVYLGKTFSSTEVRLISTDGSTLYSEGVFRLFDDVSGEDYYSTIVGPLGYFVATEDDREKLFAYAASSGYLRFEGGDWFVLVDHDASEVLKPVDELRESMMAASALVIAASLALYLLFAISISRHIRILASATSDFSRGNLDARADIRSSDEIGQLAESFNAMASELSALYHGLEDRVKERTEELEQATRKLQLLGSITRHDALNQVSVIMGWVTIIEDMTTDTTTREKLRKIVEATLNLQRYLEFTGIYERVGVKKPEWIDLGTAVTHSLFGLGPQDFELHNELSGVAVLGDSMLPKVFRNLVENSQTHGGAVRNILFSCTEVPDGLLIVYEDDGVGIPANRKEAIFERVVHSGRISFGLYLSREILSITDITITETGEPGKGARFEMLVPKGSYRMVDRRTVKGKVSEAV